MCLNNIKKIRKERKIRLEGLSQLTGLSASYLSHLENGSRSNPSYDTMKKIANAFNLDISDIFK